MSIRMLAITKRNMIRFFKLLLLLVLSFPALCQTDFGFNSVSESNHVLLDYAKIQQHSTDSSSDLHYAKLVLRFEKDLPLSLEQLQHLYYGKLYSPSYKLYAMSAQEADFNRLISNQRFRKAIPIGKQILQENPVHLEVLFKLYLCYQQLGLKEELMPVKAKVGQLLSAVISSGDGLSPETAYHVIRVGDEYVLMAMLGKTGLHRQSKMERLPNGQLATTDSWVVREEQTETKSDFHASVLLNLEGMPKFEK